MCPSWTVNPVAGTGFVRLLDSASILPNMNVPDLWENTLIGPFETVQVVIHLLDMANSLIKLAKMETSCCLPLLLLCRCCAGCIVLFFCRFKSVLFPLSMDGNTKRTLSGFTQQIQRQNNMVKSCIISDNAYSSKLSECFWTVLCH